MKVNFSIPEELQEILSKESYLTDKTIVIIFGDKYAGKVIVSPIDLKDITTSLSNLERKVKETLNISNQEYNQIECLVQDKIKSAEVIDVRHLESKKVKQITVNKYSQNRRGSLYEAVLVNGEPYFVTLDHSIENINLKLVSSIEEPSRILLPPTIDEYLSEAYEFQSQEEIDSYIEKAKKENNISLFKWAKSIVSKYVDQESHIVNLTAIYINSSYFQDRFSTVPYMGIFGGNGNGKSSIGDTYEALGYRVYNTTDPTPANIFRSLGNVEPGQITLVLDESERIDQNPDMMSILKTGYDIRKTVSRVNQFTGKPEKFNTYCQKVIIGERSPSPVLARGVNDRILGDVAYYGNPQYDIKEVLNPTNTGGEELKQLLSEITEFRKTMLIYRLLHFRDIIPDIQVKVSGRDKELVKPSLQLFSKFSTEKGKRIYEEEIQNTFTTLLAIKNEKKTSTLEFALIPLIIDLMEESKTKIVKFSDFWDKLPYYIKGKMNENKPNEYNTEDYSTIYRNTISNTLEKLGVKTKRQNSFVKLIFDKKKIKKTASQYGFVIQEKIPGSNGEGSERSEGLVDSKAEKFLTDGDKIVKLPTENNTEQTNNRYISTKKDKNSDSSKILERKNDKDPSHSIHRIHSVHLPDRALKPNLYRMGNTDTIGCRECKVKGDKWFMNKHHCRGLERK
jgi:hypothetical protein